MRRLFCFLVSTLLLISSVVPSPAGSSLVPAGCRTSAQLQAVMTTNYKCAPWSWTSSSLFIDFKAIGSSSSLLSFPCASILKAVTKQPVVWSSSRPVVSVTWAVEEVQKAQMMGHNWSRLTCLCCMTVTSHGHLMLLCNHWVQLINQLLWVSVSCDLLTPKNPKQKQNRKIDR